MSDAIIAAGTLAVILAFVFGPSLCGVMIFRAQARMMEAEARLLEARSALVRATQTNTEE